MQQIEIEGRLEALTVNAARVEDRFNELERQGLEAITTVRKALEVYRRELDELTDWVRQLAQRMGP